MDEHTSHELAYKKGYEKGKQDAMKWIPVTDRLPENDYGKHWKERKYYIVCLQGGRIRVARYGFKEYGWWVDGHACVLSKDHDTEVTHWMESPQPPKGE